MKPALLLMLLTVLCVAPDVVSAQDEEDVKQTEEAKTFTSRDGWSLPAAYYSHQSKSTPVIIMVAGKGSSHLAWNQPLVTLKGRTERVSLAKMFQLRGYAVITVDLRKNGKAKHPNPRVNNAKNLGRGDYIGMIADLNLVKDFILEEHQAGHLNMRKLGIIAGDYQALIAAQFAVADWNKRPWPDAPTLAARTPRGQDVRAVAMLSPEDSIPFIPGGTLYKALMSPAWNVGTFIGYGASDKVGAADAERIKKYLTSGAGDSEERVTIHSYPSKARGADLLFPRNTQLIAHLYAFFEKALKERPDPWVNRKPAL